MRFNIICTALASIIATPVSTAENTQHAGEWHVGIGTGAHFSSTHFSDIDKETYPDNSSNFSGVFTIFGEYSFGNKLQFSVRPELAFLTRGGHLNNIGSNLTDYSAAGIENISYNLKATYFDIRVPIAYTFLDRNARFRPYVYIAPVLGFVTGGKITGETVMADRSTEGVDYGLGKSNITSTYFAGAIGIGAKYTFDISGHNFYIGAEASYQHGFTDTFSSDEKNGNVANVTRFFGSGNLAEGSRKFSGWELKATLGIPLSAFRKKQTEPVVIPEPEAPVCIAPAPAAPGTEEPPCYSLDEIITLMNHGENITGKTICAIDDINFDFGKSTINAESHPYLDKLAATLIRTNSRIEVKGHTDNVGSEEFNLNLSKDRALAVVKYLENMGVDKSKLSYSYYGMSRPLVPNDSEENRTINRRVEFEILGN